MGKQRYTTEEIIHKLREAEYARLLYMAIRARRLACERSQTLKQGISRH